MTLTIYHNPRCSKSRKTLELIEQHGITPRIVQYLETPPDAATVHELARKLGLPVRALLRDSEPGSRALPADDDAVAEAIAIHPEWLQRPIVVDEATGAAVIGRPPENVIPLLRA